MKLDLFSFVQKDRRVFSFMSQCIGLMADLDLGTEHLRWMGDTRFAVGFLRGGKMSIYFRDPLLKHHSDGTTSIF